MGHSHSHPNSSHNHLGSDGKHQAHDSPSSRKVDKKTDIPQSEDTDADSPTAAKNGLETLSSRQKFLLRQTWDLGKQDMDRLGFTTFSEVFEQRPQLRSIFLSSWNVSEDDLALDDRLLSHGLRVSTIIGRVVDSLDDIPVVDNMLSELGKRHISYGVKSEMIPVIGIHFLSSLAPLLEAEALWTAEIETCWNIVIDHITNALMKQLSESHQDA